MIGKRSPGQEQPSVWSELVVQKRRISGTRTVLAVCFVEEGTW